MQGPVALGIGFYEIFLILVVALIVFGPKRLPELSRAIGRGLRQFKKGMQDLEESFEVEGSQDDAASARSKTDATEPESPPQEKPQDPAV
jgi:TatA/E family protein of Tat protein translocase